MLLLYSNKGTLNLNDPYNGVKQASEYLKLQGVHVNSERLHKNRI